MTVVSGTVVLSVAAHTGSRVALPERGRSDLDSCGMSMLSH